MKPYVAAVLVMCFAVAPLPAQPARDVYGDPLPAGAFARLGKLRHHHDAEGTCTALAILPDGKHVVSVSRPKREGKATWHLWDGDGRPLFQALIGDETVRAIALSPLGDRLALLTGPDEDRIDGDSREVPRYAIEVWDLLTRRKLESIPLGERRVSAILLPDRDTILIVEAIKDTFHLKNVRTNAVARSWQRKTKSENWTASADGKWLTTTRIPGEDVSVWDTATGKHVGDMKVPGLDRYQAQVESWHKSGVTKIVTDGGTVHRSDKESIQLKRQGYDPIRAAALAPDGKTVFAATQSGAITQWDCTTGKEISDPDRPRAGVYSLSLSPGARLVAAANRLDKPALGVWDVAAGKRVLEETLGDHYFDHAFAADGTFAYINNQRLFVTPAPGKTKPREFDKPTNHQNYTLRFSPDGKMLYLNTTDGVNRWTVADGKQLPIVESFKLWSGPLEFSPDGKWVALGHRNEQIIRVEAATGKERSVLFDADESLRGERSTWGSLQFVSNSQLLVAHAFQSEVQLLDLPSKKVRQRWQWKLEFSDRKCGLSPSNTGPIAVLPHGQSALMVPDGGRAELLKTDNVARRSNLIRLIDLATGGIRLELDPHQGNRIHIALSPDGRYLASGGRDGTILLWDLYAKQPGPAPTFDQCWDALRGKDGPEIQRALCALVQQPERAVKFLQTKLTPAGPKTDPALVRKWIAALESAEYRERQSANAKLQKLHREAEPELRRALAKAPSLETERRIEILLADCAVDTPDQMRVRRVLEALEMMQHPAAVRFLEALAEGTAGMFPTPEVQTALERIGRHRLGI